MLSQIIINFSVSIIVKLSEIVIISHLFNVSEVVFKMRRHSTAALTWQPGQEIENLPWNQSQQDLFILMQEFHLEGAVSSLGLGRKLKQHEFEEKDLRIIDVIFLQLVPHIGNPVKLFPLFPARLNYLDHSLPRSSQVGPGLII